MKYDIEPTTTTNRPPNQPFFNRQATGSTQIVQPKLTVGASNDAHEREADQTADRVMRKSEGDITTPITSVSSIQRKESGAKGGFIAPPSVSRAISRSGQALEPAAKTFMESRFNRKFDGVQVHTDGEAANSARDISARAYTSGNHIVFGEGQYQPNTEGGRHLLAHELTHVVQQGEENNKKIQRSDKENPIEKIAKPLDLAKTILELKGDGISVKTEKVENLFFNEKVKGNYTDAQKKTAMDYLLIPRDYIFEFRLPSFPLQSTLIYLKLRMTYETNGMGIGNISFSIVDSDSSMAGWQSDFEVMLTTSEIPVGGKTFIGSKFRLTINYNSKGWVGSESSSFLYEIDSFGGVKIIHGNSGKRMLQYNYPEGSKAEKYRKIVHQIAE